jgi:hypothetical protein
MDENDVDRHARCVARSRDQICSSTGGAPAVTDGDSTVLASPKPSRRGIAALGALRASQRISTHENSRIDAASAISARDASLTYPWPAAS